MNQLRAKNLDLSKVRIAYIEACWHQDIVSQARLAFVGALSKKGIGEHQVDLLEVPGSLEIPLQAKQLAQSGRYDVIAACGLIVDGGIYRHDFVASTVLDAMMQVSLEASIPVLSIVLTPHMYHEHQDHHQFFHAHFKKKGEEAANACLVMLDNQQCHRELGPV